MATPDSKSGSGRFISWATARLATASNNFVVKNYMGGGSCRTFLAYARQPPSRFPSGWGIKATTWTVGHSVK